MSEQAMKALAELVAVEDLREKANVADRFEADALWQEHGARSRAALVAARATLQAEPAAPREIDYTAAIEHCYATLGHAQGTKGCIAFARGAEWYRALATPPVAPEPAPQAPERAEADSFDAETDPALLCLYLKRNIAEHQRLEAEVLRLTELADSEGTRAVTYLRRARKAEALTAPQARLAEVAAGRKPIHITHLIDWLSARYRAAGGKEGVTDLSAWSEEVMRWTERSHGISFGNTTASTIAQQVAPQAQPAAPVAEGAAERAEFKRLYAVACASSRPEDWMKAALQAQRWNHATTQQVAPQAQQAGSAHGIGTPPSAEPGETT